MNQRQTQVVVTVVALGTMVIHLIWPEAKIDAITLILLGAAGVPWLLPLFKRLELPGGVKLEFQDLQATERRAAQVGLLDEPPAQPPVPDHEYSFQLVADEDPNLALAGLRIEIERRLQRVAQAAGVSSARMSVANLLNVLGERGLLTAEQRSVLSDMVGLLNRASHGAVADRQSADWALAVGPRLLSTLDKRVAQQPVVAQ